MPSFHKFQLEISKCCIDGSILTLLLSHPPRPRSRLVFWEFEDEDEDEDENEPALAAICNRVKMHPVLMGATTFIITSNGLMREGRGFRRVFAT